MKRKTKTVKSKLHYSVIVTLAVSYAATFNLGMLFAAQYGIGLGSIAYMVESAGIVRTAHASQVQLHGKNIVSTACPTNVGIIDGSGKGTVALTDAQVFISLGETDPSGAKYNGLMVVQGFSSDYQTGSLRVLEGTGTISFSGKNRIVVIGDSWFNLTGNYSFRSVPIISYCGVPPVEPEP